MTPRLLPCLLAIAALTGCGSDPQPIRVDAPAVYGRVSAPNVAPGDTRLFTNPVGAGGVQLSSQAGGGQRPVTLNGDQVERLIDRLDDTLDGWTAASREKAFRRPIDFGVVQIREQAPYSVEFIKYVHDAEPWLLVTLGYADAKVEVALDRENTRRWRQDLKRASGQDL